MKRVKKSGDCKACVPAVSMRLRRRLPGASLFATRPSFGSLLLNSCLLSLEYFKISRVSERQTGFAPPCFEPVRGELAVSSEADQGFTFMDQWTRSSGRPLRRNQAPQHV